MQKQNCLSVPLMLAVIAGLACWYWYVGQSHVSYTMDSLTYRDVAINILNGNGLVITNTFSPIPQFVPLLQWPAAYPSLWAALATTGMDIDFVPRVLSALLYILTVGLVYVIGYKLARNNLAGATGAFLYAALPTGQAIFNFAWSETLFIPLILMAFVALLQYDSVNGRARAAWLGGAALCIALANWTRYTGAIFLPLLGISIYFMTAGSRAKKVKESALTFAASMLLVAPLWIRNQIMAGTISGAGRGSYARIGAGERLVSDFETLWNLVIYPVFAFDTVLYALLGWPFLALATYIAWTHRGRLIKPRKSILLAFVWAVVVLIFLLWARIVQQGIDFDYRMLAVPAPFFIAALVAVLMDKLNTARGVLLAAIAVLSSISLFNDGLRIHQQIVDKISPNWRSLAFGIIYIDLHKDFSFSKSIDLPPIPSDAVIVTDYRGLLIRYLTNHAAYQVSSEESCQLLKKRLQPPLVFVVAQPTSNSRIANSKTPAANCAAGSI